MAKGAGIPCFFLEATQKVQQGLRRYVPSAKTKCPGPDGYHHALVLVPERIVVPVADALPTVHWPPDDPRWPKRCAGCSYEFAADDARQGWVDRIYRRVDTEALTSLRDAKPGAMWYAHWMDDWPSQHGPDGHALMVKLPDGHEWHVDSRANNCDSPCKTCGRPYNQHRPGLAAKDCKDYEDARPHKCWVRKGVPPLVDVGKDGVTCGAGGGSILTPAWHGFLRNGILVKC